MPLIGDIVRPFGATAAMLVRQSHRMAGLRAQRPRRKLMRLNPFIIAAVLGAAAMPVAASAQAWQPIGQRKVNLAQRIDQGIRSGALNRAEARRLTMQLDNLVRLERRYRVSRPGLTQAERRDLDRRYDGLSRRVRVQRNDRQNRY